MFENLHSFKKPEDLIGGQPELLMTGALDRRDILKLGFVALIGMTVPLLPSKSSYASSNHASWRVRFRHAHTGESFNGVYRVGDKYLPEAFERINYVLRDFRTGEAFPMDPRILDIASIVQKRIDSSEHLEILSGYRSPKTNAMLRRSSSGVAKNSFHMYGQAVDVRLPGYSTRKLRKVAINLKAGGVGYYTKSNFVHFDTGKTRSW